MVSEYIYRNNEIYCVSISGIKLYITNLSGRNRLIPSRPARWLNVFIYKRHTHTHTYRSRVEIITFNGLLLSFRGTNPARHGETADRRVALPIAATTARVFRGGGGAITNPFSPPAPLGDFVRHASVSCYYSPRGKRFAGGIKRQF